jgi:hypothetical protein
MNRAKILMHKFALGEQRLASGGGKIEVLT